MNVGMSLNDFAQVNKNLKGQGHKNPSKPKIDKTKGKFCHHCGFQVRSAIVKSMFFNGDFCNDCIKEMGQYHD